jgi:hypothetical protein
MNDKKGFYQIYSRRAVHNCGELQRNWQNRKNNRGVKQISMNGAFQRDPAQGRGGPQSLPTEWTGSNRKHLLAHVLGVSILVLFGVCDVKAKPRAMKIEKETELRDVRGAAATVVVGANDTFVVAGTLGSAWAVAVDRQGHFLWRYDEPAEAGIRVPIKSEFKGAVVLPSRNVMLCGQEATPTGTAGLIVVLNVQGGLVMRAIVAPQSNPKMLEAGFYQCISWGADIALFGRAVTSDVNGPSLWFRKVDVDGKEVDDMLIADLGGAKAVSLSADEGTLASVDIDQRNVHLYRVDRSLRVLKSTSVQGFAFQVIHGTGSSGLHERLIVFQRNGLSKLYTFDDQLSVVRSVLLQTSHFIADGGGYLRNDKSFVLFGHIVVPSGALSAAVALMEATGRVSSIHAFMPFFESFTVKGGVALGDDRFLAVRNISSNALAITWILTN